MVGIIVSGHGEFAKGICSALDLIVGKQEDLIQVNFPFGDGASDLETHIKSAIEQLNHCESILIFTDLLSGSPFNMSVLNAMKNNRIQVVYGTNLGMLMECVMKRNSGASIQELVALAIATGKEQVGVFDANKVGKDEDDF